MSTETASPSTQGSPKVLSAEDILLLHDAAAMASEAQARAALYVLANSDFTGRKHPDAQAFITAAEQQGINLKSLAGGKDQ